MRGWTPGTVLIDGHRHEAASIEIAEGSEVAGIKYWDPDLKIMVYRPMDIRSIFVTRKTHGKARQRDG